MEGVTQSEEDKLAVLKWTIALVCGQEEDVPLDDELEGKSITETEELRRSDLKESNKQVEDRNEPSAQGGGLNDPTESMSLDASARLNNPTGTMSLHTPVQVDSPSGSTSNDTPVRPHHLQVVDDAHTQSPTKRRKIGDDVEPAVGAQVIPDFDPASLVTPKEGMVIVPEIIANYLNKK